MNVKQTYILCALGVAFTLLSFVQSADAAMKYEPYKVIMLRQADSLRHCFASIRMDMYDVTGKHLSPADRKLIETNGVLKSWEAIHRHIVEAEVASNRMVVKLGGKSCF